MTAEDKEQSMEVSKEVPLGAPLSDHATRDHEAKITMAVRLLQSPSLGDIPTNEKLSYLKGKGVTQSQIEQAWEQLMESAINQPPQYQQQALYRRKATIASSVDGGTSVDLESPDPPGATDFYKMSTISKVPPPAPVPIQVPYIATKNPKDTLKAVYKAGVYKAGLPFNVLALQCFMAGIYISMAGHLMIAVGGGILGSALFPTGLIAVVLTSAELFTGDALVFVASVLGGQVSVKNLLRNWCVAWTFNFIGSLTWAGLLVFASDALVDKDQVELAIHIAEKKALQPWIHIFLKAIGANFMVCVGIWQATCAEEVSGKILALWFPIAAFVMMGFDHVIANQFLIPIGMMYGADIGVGHLFYGALLPATLGNIVGGGILVGAVYWYVFDSMTVSTQIFDRIRRTFAKR